MFMYLFLAYTMYIVHVYLYGWHSKKNISVSGTAGVWNEIKRIMLQNNM